jgi:DNA topoisomerase-1
MSDELLIAYCIKCKEKREIKNPQPVFTRIGTPGTRGECVVCGANVFKAGATPAHEGLPKPEVVQSRRSSKGKRKRRRRPTGDGKLVIVESPAKARTVGRFLGKDYVVKASVGHVRDLLRSQLSVDVENDFEPRYRVPKEKREVVKELVAEVKKAAQVYLATDPDREGEAIAWHLMEATGIHEEQMRRVVFHEITKGAIEEAFSQPSEINMRLVDAQQARRILDRLVGYKISPLLWDRVRNRTSAGRVQSVALRLIVEREREIQAFDPVEYWSIEAELAKKEPEGKKKRKKRRSFIAKLHKIDGQDVDLKNESDTQKIVDDLEKATYVVAKVRRGQRRRNPSAPYTTSTMQQEASRRLGFTARRTMANAQGLYEGVEIGDEGTVGLITYMRTDSVNVAEVAQAEARAYITDRYGADFLPPKPPVYKTKAKRAQEAHEAIRPTSVHREPKMMKPYLSRDQYRLYQLIWKRFVASQMTAAIYDTMSVEIEAGPPVGERPYLFRASGSKIKFRGFLIVYEEARDEDEAPDEETGRILPDVEVGELLDLLQLLPEQHFTQPPPRYTEASLVKTLEEHGIGRPSTYAPIISTIQTRGYVERMDRRLVPTEIGMVVNDLVVEYFSDVVDYGFTAQMEENLDLIAVGEKEWVPVVREFYVPFEKDLTYAEEHMPKQEIADQPTGETCEKCGHPMIIKFGRYGKFIACSNFPDCRNTKSYMEKIGVACPECGGDLVRRKTRRNRYFYGCANYPECEFSVWNLPLPQPCPECGGLLTQSKKEWAKCVKCESEIELNLLPEVEKVEE